VRKALPKTKPRSYPEPPRHYYVYVIEVSDRGKRTFYVGQSGKTPEARAREHASGQKKFCGSCKVRHYAGTSRTGSVRLRHDLFSQYNPVDTRGEAERIERWLARKLRARGYHVVGGH
jgi:hypothetical protein